MEKKDLNKALLIEGVGVFLIGFFIKMISSYYLKNENIQDIIISSLKTSFIILIGYMSLRIIMTKDNVEDKDQK